MEDCRESLDGESVSGDADEVCSNLDVVELESRPSSSSTLVASATTTTQQISALPSIRLSKLSTSAKPSKPSSIAESVVQPRRLQFLKEEANRQNDDKSINDDQETGKTKPQQNSFLNNNWQPCPSATGASVPQNAYARKSFCDKIGDRADLLIPELKEQLNVRLIVRDPMYDFGGDQYEMCPSAMDNYAESYISTSSSRMARNLAEKMRRDKLNTHINELSTLVPMTAGSSKKMDKTSILRLSATYIRMNKTLKPDKSWQLLPKELGTINLSQYLMEDMEGFLLIITAGARIIFISHTVEKYLGHSQIEIMGQSLYNICHEDDREELKKNLTPDEGFPSYCGADSQSHEDSSSSDTSTTSSSAQSSPAPAPASACVDPPTSTSCDSPTSAMVDRQRRSFYIRLLQKASSRTDQPQYEHVHIIGDLRVPTKLEVHATPTRSRRQREHSFNENDIVLVAVGRLYREREVSSLCLLEAKKEEYVTRHEPNGKMIYIDHRIAIVAGYLSEEVLGLSAFNFMHKDDVTWVMIALKQMYDKGEGSGSSVYRLKTKNGEHVYMRTCGYLEFDQNTQSIGSFICVNSLLSKEEGEQGIAEMKRRYTPNVLKTLKELPDGRVSATMADLALHGVDNYQKLNVAIRELVSSLHSPVAAGADNSSQISEESASPTSASSPSQCTCKNPRVVEMVTSSTEVTGGLTRPTVLREVTSYPVSSSTHHTVMCAKSYPMSPEIPLNEDGMHYSMLSSNRLYSVD